MLLNRKSITHNGFFIFVCQVCNKTAPCTLIVQKIQENQKLAHTTSINQNGELSSKKCFVEQISED